MGMIWDDSWVSSKSNWLIVAFTEVGNAGIRIGFGGGREREKNSWDQVWKPWVSEPFQWSGLGRSYLGMVEKWMGNEWRSRGNVLWREYEVEERYFQIGDVWRDRWRWRYLIALVMGSWGNFYLIVSLFSLSKSAKNEKDLRKCGQDWTFEIIHNIEWEEPCNVVSTGEGPVEVNDHELVLVVVASFFSSGIQLHAYRHWKPFSLNVRILSEVITKVQRGKGV